MFCSGRHVNTVTSSPGLLHNGTAALRVNTVVVIGAAGTTAGGPTAHCILPASFRPKDPSLEARRAPGWGGRTLALSGLRMEYLRHVRGSLPPTSLSNFAFGFSLLSSGAQCRWN